MTGLTLIAIFALLLALSKRFAYGMLPVLERPTGTIVAMLMLAGAVHLMAVFVLRVPRCPSRQWWLWMIAVGLVMRALMLPSTPILETDYYRYLWDGGVVAAGMNPHAHSPQDVLDGDAPAELIALGEQSGMVLERANEPTLTTIYPATAQAAFAMAHALMPWRIEGLRVVFLGLDILTFLMLLGLLREVELPRSLSMIYWWNPLLVKEGMNSAHMELTLLPLLIAAIWLAVRLRAVVSAAVLGLAIGSKLWPVILLPALLYRRGVTMAHAALAFGLCAAIGGLLVAPMLLARLDQDAGLIAYATTWQTNASLFQLVQGLAGLLTATDGRHAARIAVGMLLLLWTLWLCRTPAADGRMVCERALWITAGLFLLSPTQYPWYWLWLLPMLVVRPSPGLLLLGMMLPMYYLRFPMRELGLTAWFNHGVIWLQFAPALLVLGVEAACKLRRRDPTQLTRSCPAT